MNGFQVYPGKGNTQEEPRKMSRGREKKRRVKEHSLPCIVAHSKAKAIKMTLYSCRISYITKG